MFCPKCGKESPPGVASCPTCSTETSVTPLSNDSTQVPQIRPWVRYWARALDLYSISLIGGIGIGILYPSLFESKAGEQIFGIIICFVWVFFEAGLLSTFQTTPGKWLLKVKVAPASGEPFTYSKALDRSIKVWIYGMGFALPLISLFTLVLSYNKLTNEGATKWDRNNQFVVTHERIGIARDLCTVAIFIFFGAIMVLGATE